MKAITPDCYRRDRRLHALGVTPLRLRRAPASHLPEDVAGPVLEPVAADLPAEIPRPSTVVTAAAPQVPHGIRRLALQADPAERRDPAINKMYMDLSAAVAQAGLQPVRVCDVAEDAGAAVMVFGTAPAPADVPVARILHVDALVALHADRGRKRQLWEQLLALGCGGGD